MIFGQPIDLETDCKALADLLGNKKLSTTHDRWRESIIARDIRAVQHIPGSTNTVCNALPRIYEHRADTDEEEGQYDDVNPGWEAGKGLANNLYYLLDDADAADLLHRFQGDSFSEDILRALVLDPIDQPDDQEGPSTPDNRARRRGAHRVEGFAVEAGKLWLVAGKHMRQRDQVECIPQSEAVSLALSAHSAQGHFGRDMTVLALQQHYFWPTLCRDATEAV
ncbi:hypothetical protein BDV93DRAFT_458081, partial [Ceratobasidium sp. AG-I]